MEDALGDEHGAVLLDGLDHALVGVAAQSSGPRLAVYDRGAILAGLVRDGLDPDEADEHISFNIEGLWAGEGTPLVLTRVEDM